MRAERGLTRAEADVYLTKSPFFVRYPHWSELTAWIQPLDFPAFAMNTYGIDAVEYVNQFFADKAEETAYLKAMFCRVLPS